MPYNALALLSVIAGLDLPSDPLAGTGLDPNAPQRIRDLVAKGLLYEYQEELRAAQEQEALIRATPKRKGRPRNAGTSINGRRAVYLEVLAEVYGLDGASDLDLIRYAKAREDARRAGMKERGERELWRADEPTLQKSVSYGKREIGSARAERGLPKTRPRRST